MYIWVIFPSPGPSSRTNVNAHNGWHLSHLISRTNPSKVICEMYKCNLNDIKWLVKTFSTDYQFCCRSFKMHYWCILVSNALNDCNAEIICFPLWARMQYSVHQSSWLLGTDAQAIYTLTLIPFLTLTITFCTLFIILSFLALITLYFQMQILNTTLTLLASRYGRGFNSQCINHHNS